MPDLWGGERPIDDDLLAQLLEGEEQPAVRVHEIPFSRPSSRPHPSSPMARSKSSGKKRPESESNPTSPAQPGSQAGVPSTSGRENLVPDPNIQTRARPRHQNPLDVEWYTSPASSVTPRMVANYFRKFPLTGVTITRPTADQRANRPGGANSAWSRYHIEARAYLPLHPFFVGVANYFGVAPFQITPNGYRMLAALYVLYKLNKWPEPSPHEVNYLFDLKSNP